MCASGIPPRAVRPEWAPPVGPAPDVRLLDGGRAKWEAEGREMTTDTPTFPPTRYEAPARSDSRIRAFLSDDLEPVYQQPRPLGGAVYISVRPWGGAGGGHEHTDR